MYFGGYNQGGTQQSTENNTSFTLPVSFSNKILAIFFGREGYTCEVTPNVVSYSLSAIKWGNMGVGGNQFKQGTVWIISIGY